MAGSFSKNKEEGMAEEAIDSEARRMAQDAQHQADRAHDRLAASEALAAERQKSIDNSLTRHSVFETEMRQSVRDLHDRQIQNHEKQHEEIHATRVALTDAMNTGMAALHTRINQLVLLLLVGTIGLVVKIAYDVVMGG